MGLDLIAHHQWMIHSPTVLESKRDPGTWNGTRCDGPPPVALRAGGREGSERSEARNTAVLEQYMIAS
jgi:hypothetical protein